MQRTMLLKQLPKTNHSRPRSERQYSLGIRRGAFFCSLPLTPHHSMKINQRRKAAGQPLKHLCTSNGPDNAKESF